MTSDDFEPLTIIGRGAFGEVSAVLFLGNLIWLLDYYFTLLNLESGSQSCFSTQNAQNQEILFLEIRRIGTFQKLE